jgi:hypothetical protein
MEVLQTSALPLGYGAAGSIVTPRRGFLNPAGTPAGACQPMVRTADVASYCTG